MFGALSSADRYARRGRLSLCDTPALRRLSLRDTPAIRRLSLRDTPAFFICVGERKRGHPAEEHQYLKRRRDACFHRLAFKSIENVVIHRKKMDSDL